VPLTGLASSELPLPDYNEKATKLISFLKRLIFWNGGSNTLVVVAGNMTDPLNVIASFICQSFLFSRYEGIMGQ
jgi:hypothetical protein